MKENFNTLRQRATQIKNEVEDGANTSARVGSFCEDVVDTMTGTITEYNVSVQHPTSGIDGSNKYSLESAIAQVPQELRNIGLKVSFINSDGKVETWEFQGGTFTDVGSWKQQVQRTEIMKLKQEDLLLEEANNTNAKFISDWGWQKGNRDYATGAFKEGPYFVSDIVDVEGESFDFQTDKNADFVCCYSTDNGMSFRNSQWLDNYHIAGYTHVFIILATTHR